MPIGIGEPSDLFLSGFLEKNISRLGKRETNILCFYGSVFLCQGHRQVVEAIPLGGDDLSYPHLDDAGDRPRHIELEDTNARIGIFLYGNRVGSRVQEGLNL